MLKVGAGLLQVFEAFDTEGEGSLGYEGVAALVRRQLPDLTPAELRGIMSHVHLLDRDGAACRWSRKLENMQ